MSVGVNIDLPLELSAVIVANPHPLSASSPQAAEIPARRRLPAFLACPRRHSKAIHRSRRRGLDWIMSAIGFLPARCFTCDRRFYARQLPLKALRSASHRVPQNPLNVFNSEENPTDHFEDVEKWS